MMSAACTYRHCFNIVTSSSRLGTFAGVLTALTFSALIFLAGRKPKRHQDLDHTLTLFVTAFVSMAVSTYLYTGAASEEGIPGGRVALEGFCAGLAFSSALLPLFLGIALLIRGSGFSGVVGFAARMVNWVGGVLIFVFMCLTAISSSGIDTSVHAAWHSSLALTCGLLVIGLLAWLVFGPDVPWLDRQKAVEVWSGYTVGIVAIASSLYAIWGELPTSESMPTGGYVALLVLLLFAILGYATALKRLARAG